MPARKLCAVLSSRARYTTLLRAVELWGAVRADGPGRLAGDEELPPVNGLAVCREEDFSQQIKANPEDRLSAVFVGFVDDVPVFACHSPVAWANAKATANTARSLPIRSGGMRWGFSEMKPRVLVAAKSVSISHRRR